MVIKCCKDCDNRYPGCHGSCPEYLAQRAEYDKLREEYKKKRDIDDGIYYQRTLNVYKAIKKRQKGKKGDQ